MKTQIYTLPDWDFVGGETQKRSLTLQQQSGAPYDLPGSSAHMAVVEFVNPHSAAVLTKDLAVTDDMDGNTCIVKLTISPAETVRLAGKYIYQVTVKDANGNTSIPQKGIMHIERNIDRSWIS